MPYIFGKLWHLAMIWAIRKAFQCILQGVRILLAKYTRISPTSENDSYVCMYVCVRVCVCVWVYTGTDTSLRCNLRVVEIRRTCTQLSSERDIFGQAHSVSLFCCHYWTDSRPKVDRDNPNTYRDYVLVNSIDYQRWLILVLTVVGLSIPVPCPQPLSKLMTAILLTMRSKDKD